MPVPASRAWRAGDEATDHAGRLPRLRREAIVSVRIVWTKVAPREWTSEIGRIYDRGPTKPRGGRGPNPRVESGPLPPSLYRETRFVLELRQGDRRVCEGLREAKTLARILWSKPRDWDDASQQPVPRGSVGRLRRRDERACASNFRRRTERLARTGASRSRFGAERVVCSGTVAGSRSWQPGAHRTAECDRAWTRSRREKPGRERISLPDTEKRRGSETGQRRSRFGGPAGD